MAVYRVEVQPDKHRIIIRHLGLYSTADCVAVAEEFKRLAATFGGQPFTVLVDAQDGRTLTPDGFRVMEDLQRWARAHGMRKSAVVSTDPVLMLQFRRLGRQSGIYDNERHFAALEEAEAYLDE